MAKYDKRLARVARKFKQWHRSRRTPKPSAWVAVYEEKKGSYLVGLRSDSVGSPGTWGIPGGGFNKRNEDPVKGALRELEEETQARLLRKKSRVKSGDLKFIAHSRKANLYMMVIPKRGYLVTRKNRETAKFRWMTTKELKALRRGRRHYSLNFMLRHIDKIDKSYRKAA